MFDFFESILGFFETVGQFIENLIGSLIMAVIFMTKSVTFALALIQYVPAIIGSAIVIFLAIYIIRFLLLK